MLLSLSKDPNVRKGNVAVTVAASLVMMMGFTALTIDGGMLMDLRRYCQSSSDAAAIAGASQLYYEWWSYSGLDGAGNAAAAARATAAAAGYVDGQNGCTVTVNIPPLSGPFTGLPGHCEVIIKTSQARYFSRLWGQEVNFVSTRAVARGKTSQIGDAIICLDPYNKGSLSSGGNGVVTVTGAPIQVNSTDSQAMIANGGGTLAASEFDVVGSPGWATPGGGTFAGPIMSNSDPMPDPLSFLPVPDPSTMPVQSTNKSQYAGNKTTTLSPGVYNGGISATGGTLILSPGVYYMQGGGFSIGGQASLQGAGVMIYNAPQSNSDTLSIAGSGAVNLSPMMSGPYQGVLLFQDRNATTPVSVSGSSGTTMTVSGAFYAANATLNVTGNGNQQTIGSQYISKDLVLGGNGTYSCNWTPQNTPGRRDILLVE